MKEEKTKQKDFEASFTHHNDEPTTPKPTLGSNLPDKMDEGETHIDSTLQQYPNIPDDIVAQLKEKHPVMFGIYFGEKPVLYRTFNVDEYLRYQDDYMKASDDIQTENAKKPPEARMTDVQLRDYIASKADSLLVETFVVYPDDIITKVIDGEYPGGAIYTLAQSILVNNGFVDLDPLILNEKEISADPKILKELDDGILKEISDLTSKKIVDEMVKPYKEVVIMWFLNQLYIVRGFDYGEYSEFKKLMTTTDPVHLSIELVRRFILYPQDINLSTIPAGIVVKGLADSILMISGFATTTPDIIIMD